MITPAAQRLHEWFQDGPDKNFPDLEQCQKIVDVVVNMPETPDLIVWRIAEALRATLTMMAGSEEQWIKLASQIVLRAGLEGELS